MINKRNKLALIVAIFGLISLVAGSSYAIFTTNINEEGIQLVTVGNVNVEINEKSNGLNLSGISAMNDVDGYLQNNYYEFTVKNTSSTSVQYTVTLVDDTNALNNYNGNIIDDEFIKIGPEINNKKTGTYNIAEINRIVYEGYLLENGTATFKLRFWLNNEKEAELNSMTGYSKFLKVKVSATQQISEDKYAKANAPLMKDNMIPIKFDEQTHAWYKADIDNKNNDWYDYEGSIWANAATVNETTTKTKLVNIDGTEINCTNTCTRDDYLNAPIGTYIPLDDINSMWVWIPRFKYQIFNANEDGTNGVEAQQIKVYFEEGTSKTGTVECTSIIGTILNKSETCIDKKYGAVTDGLSTYTHPAFTFGDTELTGFWMAKFEASQNSVNNNIEILPNKQSLGSKPIDEFFQISREMELISNPYGFASNATEYTVTGELTGDDNNIDIHISRNMDWGAAAYLSQSRYGRCHNDSCDDIYYNNSSGYWTGSSAGAPSTKTKTLTEYCPDGNTTSTSKFTTKGYYTYDGKRNANCGYSDEYMEDLTLGYGASTTGNVYGIYDMAGCRNDMVMLNVKATSTSTTEFNYKSATSWTETIHPLEKYYDSYAYGNKASGSEFRKNALLGDAIKETATDISAASKSSWYTNGNSGMFYNYPYATRGGWATAYNYANFDTMGMFSTYYSQGGESSWTAMRLTLTIE